MEKFIASSAARALTLVFALSFVALVLITRAAEFPNNDSLYAPTLVSGLLTLLGFIYSFHGVYRYWMSFAARLQKGIATVIFGACYLFLLPFLAVFVRVSDPLKLRARASKQDTFWIQRHRDEKDAASYQRMG